MERNKIFIQLTSAIIAEEIESAADEENVNNLLLTILDRHKNKRRRVCVNNYVENIVPQYCLDDFKSHFRIKRGTFVLLLEKITPCLCNNPRGMGRPADTLERKLLITLWMAANNCVYRDIADRFNVSKSTAWEHFRSVCNVLANMSPRIIKWPSASEIKRNVEGFQKISGFPGVLGAIDGSHIEICAPHENSVSYFNRKQRYTIVAQAICDYNYQFIDFFTGYPGSVHDARHYKLSDIGKKIESGEVEIPQNCHLLGDSAYANTQTIITPYKDNGFLTETQKLYNTTHASTRVPIEQTIGLWKGRFRILKYMNIYNTPEIPQIILATAVLHNICMAAGDDDVDCNYDDPEMNDNNDPTTEEHFNSETKRDRIANYIVQLKKSNVH